MKQKGVRDPAVGVSHRETTRDERMRAIALRDHAKWSWRQIGRELKMDARTASRIYHRYQRDGSPSNRKRTGRPPIFDDEEKARLVAFITRDARTRSLSWEEVCVEMDYACSPKTNRLHWTKKEWKRVIRMNRFSFSTAGFGHRPWATRKLDEDHHPDYVDWKFHSGRKSKVVWRAFGGTKSDPIFVPGKTKLNFATYCREEYGWAIVQE
ncbi:hypothetical protein BZA05DRAFT_435253 [Tricharina praecox]|uniref:uncharacterized protein n=1 Tax=Tricharina praecox TaxID=43433 RepID=UPI00221F2196|nr:uncharacterized protein BZA05DRAFT_435253 [Tricharina praecox]KAI5854236.1 hypothetical protein BZA05DRAFT_435253 [Tricharina praecox]